MAPTTLAAVLKRVHQTYFGRFVHIPLIMV